MIFFIYIFEGKKTLFSFEKLVDAALNSNKVVSKNSFVKKV